MKKKRKFSLKRLVQLVVFVGVMYFGYNIYKDFSNFIKHPFSSLYEYACNLIGYEEKTKVDTFLLKEKLFEKQEVLFACQQMTLKYEFYREKTSKVVRWTSYKNSISRHYQWTVTNNITFKKEDLDVAYDEGQKILTLTLKNMRVAKGNQGKFDIVHSRQSKTWTDTEIPGKAFEADRYFVADEQIKELFNRNDKVENLRENATLAINELITPIINSIDNTIVVKINTGNSRILYDYKISHEKSYYYKQDNNIKIQRIGDNLTM